MPGDKSISHRALLLAAVASGTSRIRGLLPGEDPRSTARVLRALGVDVPELTQATLEIRGRGLRGLSQPAADLDCGNSGTTARLLLGILAAQPLDAVVTGDASLRSRPMRRVSEPLTRMGASIDELEAADRLPLRVRGGPLRAIAHASEHASAQVKGALMLAGLCAGVPVTVAEPALSRDHTERLLRGLGVGIRVETAGPQGGSQSALQPVQSLPALDLVVPGDFSAAAFLLALALLAGGRSLRIAGVGTNPTRTGLLPVLERMGAAVRVEAERSQCGEPVGDIVAAASSLAATTIDAAEIPTLIDEVPILAVLAAHANGETRIRGAEELRLKESDRLAVLAANLRGTGVACTELPDGLVIQGADRPLSGTVHAHGDHRIAMAFGIAAALPGSRIEIDDPTCADISFPGFWQLVRRTMAELRA